MLHVGSGRVLSSLACGLFLAGNTMAQIMINEIDYDQPGEDNAEFIEIKNTGSNSVNLSALALELYNGASGGAARYGVIALPGVDLAPGEYFVVCGNNSTVFACDLDVSPDTNLIQNGAPDAVALVEGATLLDAVSYEGDTPTYTEGSGTGVLDDPADAGSSIGRCPDGVDTNQNNADFLLADATPGAANSCPPPPQPASVVVNEVDSDTEGTDALEFIELLGPPNGALDGLVVVLYNGATDSSYAAFDLDDFMTDADGFFVLGNAAVAGANLVFPDNLLQNGADAVALYAGDAARFPSGTPVTSAGLLDALVYDTADGDDPGLLDVLTTGRLQVDEAGGGDGAGHANARVPDGGAPFDTAVYVQQGPTPGGTNQPPPPPPIGLCGEPSTPIHLIQGNGFETPVLGTSQVIEGVVVGDYQGPSGLNGFFVQEEDAQVDSDPATSEGIFVFEGSSGLSVGLGDVVRVGGSVAEFFGLTELTSIVGVEVCAPGAGGASASTVMLPVAAVSDLERYEGMLVHLPQALFVTGNFTLGRFGEVDLSVADRLFIPTSITTPGSSAAALQDLNNRRRILLDDGSNVQNPLPLPPYLAADGTLRAGDKTTNLAGVLSFGFNAYRLHPTGAVAFERLNPRPAALPDVGGTLKVASFNVLNYFTTLDGSGPICGPTGGLDCRGADNVSELERQRAKVLDALSKLDADVVGIIEVENNESESVADLVSGLNDLLGAGTYDFIDTGTVGTDAIKLGFLYKPGTVMPVGVTAVLDNVFPFDTNTRPPIAQVFEETATGRRVTLVVNHFKSKGSPCDGDPDLGDGQGNCNLTRVEAATRVLEWLATDPTGTGSDKILILGDLNAYAREDPIAILESAGYVNLIERFLGSESYSFVFSGQSGYLDHALASTALNPFVSGVAEWHINADEPVALDYNSEFNQPLLYQPDAFRSSDHDPVVVGLDLQPMRKVRIDIRPLFRDNFLNPRSNLPLAVAILSENGFDARSVDPQTVRFGPNAAAPISPPFVVDVNGDRRKDMVLVFPTRATGIRCGDTEASLTGFTFDGTKIFGTDNVVTLCGR
jgi:predicted extracellular nuclease